MIRAAGFAGAVCRSSASRSTGRSRAFIILACLVAGAAGALRGESPVQDPVEVQVILTVTDRQDRYIDGLAAQNLVLKESGVPQAITSVTPIGSEPVAMSLLVDTSNSLEEHFTAVQAAAIEVARRLRPGDSAEVLRFASGVHRELSFTGDVTRIEQVIRGLRRSGSTSLHNAVYVSLREREGLPASGGANAPRHVLVLFSDGHDTSSLMPVRELQEVVRRSASVLYAVAPHGRDLKGGHAVLRSLSHTTSGRAYIPPYRLEPGLLADRLWLDIAHHQLLRYISSHTARDGAWRRIDIHSGVSGVNVRAREGYFAPRAK